MSSLIENYLGFPKGVSGADLAERATVQARRFGTEILVGQEATKVRADGPYRYVTLSDGTELAAYVLLIATGIAFSGLNAPGVQALTGAGIYYGAAVTEAANYRGQDVVVVGGANSAGQGCMYLAKYARQVFLVVRRGWLDMSKYLRDQLAATENIRIMFQSEVVEAKGTRRLEAVTVKNNQLEETSTLTTGAMFIFIGGSPRSDLVAGIVERNDEGFILTGEDLVRDGRRPKGWNLKRDPYFLETSVPGIFAAGDVRYGTEARIASALAHGGMVVSFVEQYLKTV